MSMCLSTAGVLLLNAHFLYSSHHTLSAQHADATNARFIQLVLCTHSFLCSETLNAFLHLSGSTVKSQTNNGFIYIPTLKLRGLSPQAKYTHRATVTCRRS
jgi:hypothetical protein